jgi:hypothetical protein
MGRLAGAFLIVLGLLCGQVRAQVITFQSNGLTYQTLTRSGVTVMFAQLPTRIHEYTILQAAVSNGSQGPYTIRPEDFMFVRDDGSILRASRAQAVIAMLMRKGNGSDVMHLVTTYEASVYGNPHFKSTNGFEQRREAALAMGGAVKFRAAATASAIALVETKMAPGETTDGAVFFPNDGKPLTGGRVVVRTNTDEFRFNPEAAIQPRGERP